MSRSGRWVVYSDAAVSVVRHQPPSVSASPQVGLFGAQSRVGILLLSIADVIDILLCCCIDRRFDQVDFLRFADTHCSCKADLGRIHLLRRRDGLRSQRYSRFVQERMGSEGW